MRKQRSGWLVLVFATALAGCGPAGPKTYPIRGKIEFTGGDPGQLAGSHVEAALEQDPTVRASGEILSDGRFVLESIHGGTILKGAQEGKYQVRIIPHDEGGAKARKIPVHPRYLQFRTSGQTFRVPAEGDVVIQVSRR